MRKPIIVGNWKLNKTIAETISFINDIEPKLHADADFGVAVPYLALSAAVGTAKHLIISAQNVAFAEHGAFTGEVSVGMLKEVGVRWVIIGHSERRQYFGETDATVNQKVLLAVNNGFTPIVCVGETLTQFDAGQTENIVRTQTAAALSGLTADHVAHLVIAYEPVWAIGTGKNATQDIAQETCAMIRSEVEEHFGRATAEKVRIQYGGSVKPENIQEYLAQPDIDGALIGGASLKVESFTAIIDALKA